MGYNKRPGAVTDYADTLEQIKAAIDMGKAISFPVQGPDTPTKIRDKLHWILGCAETFTDEEDGRYAHLRSQAMVSVDWDNDAVVVKPKSATSRGKTGSPLHSRPPDEREALKDLDAVTMDAHFIKFKPSRSFDLAMFERLLQAKGWTIRVREDDPGDPLFNMPARKAGELHEVEAKAKGWLGFHATRLPQEKEERSSLLEQFGFAKGDVDS